MTTRIPETERSKQLDYYHRVAKFKGNKRYPNYKYNGGKPRANLTVLPPFQRHLAERLYDRKCKCAKEGIPYDLDWQWAATQRPFCAVTGLPLVLPNDFGPLTANIDRIDPTKGYVKSNVQLVAAWYNHAKLNWSDTIIREYILAAADHMRR